MLIFFGVLILLASVLLGLFVLIQNPKGGGLSGTFGGFNNQTMGVRQTTDFLEKGTWVLAAFIVVLCLASTFFFPANSGSQQRSIMEQNANSLPASSSTPAAQFPSSGASNGAAQPLPQQPAPKGK